MPSLSSAFSAASVISQRCEADVPAQGAYLAFEPAAVILPAGRSPGPSSSISTTTAPSLWSNSQYCAVLIPLPMSTGAAYAFSSRL